MNRLIANTVTVILAGLLPIPVMAQNPAMSMALGPSQNVLAAWGGNRDDNKWIGTWAAAPQPSMPGGLESFRNQSLRLIVHTSAGGRKVRVKISNAFGRPLRIGGAHIARRAVEAEIDPTSDRTLMFNGHTATTVPAGSMVVSDPVELDVAPLSDLAISLFLPEATDATTTHILAMQTNYVSAVGDSTGAAKFPVAKKIHSWPFLTGVDVEASPRGVAIVAFGSSLTDGDGTTSDANARWPDVLAKRLQEAKGTDGKVEIGVLNEGIIGNRLLSDSPVEAAGGRFGASLGQAGLKRFERDVLSQAGVKYVVVGLGINDIAMPGSLTPASESISAESVIAGYRQLIARAHEQGIRIIGTTNPAFEDSYLEFAPPTPAVTFFTPEKEIIRQRVNEWIRSSGEFDGVVDLDEALRDPSHPTRLLPSYDSGDHLHPNDAGCVVEGNAFPLALFESH